MAKTEEQDKKLKEMSPEERKAQKLEAREALDAGTWTKDFARKKNPKK